MRPEFAAAGIEGCLAKLVDSPYRAGRTSAWVKVRQMTVVDAVVVGVAGSRTGPVRSCRPAAMTPASCDGSDCLCRCRRD